MEMSVGWEEDRGGDVCVWWEEGRDGDVYVGWEEGRGGGVCVVKRLEMEMCVVGG